MTDLPGKSPTQKIRNVDKWLAAQRGAGVAITADDLIGYLRRTWPGISEDEIDVIHQEAGFGWRMSRRASRIQPPNYPQ